MWEVLATLFVKCKWGVLVTLFVRYMWDVIATLFVRYTWDAVKEHSSFSLTYITLNVVKASDAASNSFSSTHLKKWTNSGENRSCLQ